MGEIKEVFSYIRETVGDKWFFIFIGVAVVFGLYNLTKGSDQSGEKLTTVTSVSSYPDAVTNANVIIDTLQDSIQYSEDRIKESIDKTENTIMGGMAETENNILGSIESKYNDLSSQMSAGFESTNNLINSGIDSMNKNYNNLSSQIGAGFDSTNNYINKGLESMTDLHEKIDMVQSGLDVGNNISAMHYYEYLIANGWDKEVPLNALENAGFNTSKEMATEYESGLLKDYAPSKGEGKGTTTFTGHNTL